MMPGGVTALIPALNKADLGGFIGSELAVVLVTVGWCLLFESKVSFLRLVLR